MTPREYLDLVVKPNAMEFSADVSDPRLIYNAIATTDALAAHIYCWCRKNAPHEVTGLKDDSAYRRWMRKNHAQVELLHDVAKALKHFELDSSSKVKTAAEVEARPMGFGEGLYSVGPFGGTAQSSVIVDGDKVQLQWTVQNTIEFYEREMDRLGI